MPNSFVDGGPDSVPMLRASPPNKTSAERCCCPTRRGLDSEHRRQSSDQGADVRVIAPIPAATLSPRLASTLRGCSANELLKPPTNALAPTPTPTVALAVAPAEVPASAPGATAFD